MKEWVLKCVSLWLLLCMALIRVHAHPLKLSISEIEYLSEQQRLAVSLRLFLSDVNEALVFDPQNNELKLAQANEAKHAQSLLLDYLDDSFYLKVNGEKLPLSIVKKSLTGEGINQALVVDFAYQLEQGLRTLEVKNIVFTDLFSDQNNIVYVYIDEDSFSFMLNQQTPIHQLAF